MTPKQESHSIRDALISQRESYHDLNDCPGFVLRQDGTNELSARFRRARNISPIHRHVKQRTFTISGYSFLPASSQNATALAAAALSESTSCDIGMITL